MYNYINSIIVLSQEEVVLTKAIIRYNWSFSAVMWTGVGILAVLILTCRLLVKLGLIREENDPPPPPPPGAERSPEMIPRPLWRGISFLNTLTKLAK